MYIGVSEIIHLLSTSRTSLTYTLENYTFWSGKNGSPVIEKGKSSEPKLHDFGFKMLIFRGVQKPAAAPDEFVVQEYIQVVIEFQAFGSR